MTNREYVMMLAKMYFAGSHNPAEYETATPQPSKVYKTNNKEEFGHIEFFLVGHNASHDFSLGVDALDNVYHRSFCAWYDEDHAKDVVEENIEKVTYNIQGKNIYIGHW